MKTELVAKLLNQVLTSRGWTQTDLANRAGIAPSVVNWHISRTRPVRDNHLIAYLRALDLVERPMLLAAWLRDTLPLELIHDIFGTPVIDDARVAEMPPTTSFLRREVIDWRPELDEEQRNMLGWWAHQLVHDPEIDEIFRQISRKAGWPNPLDKSDIPFVITDGKGRVIHINAAFTKMCGYSLAQLRGKKPGDVLQGKDTDKRIVRNFALALRDRRPVEAILVNYDVAGAPYKVRIQCFPVFDFLGGLIQFRATEAKLG